MTNAHLRAVVRLALRSHGFSMRKAAFSANVQAHWKVGTALRDTAFPKRLPDYAQIEDYIGLAASESELWRRLPWMAATGFMEARSFQGCDSDADPSITTLLAGAFTTAIVVSDYLADELSLGDAVFEVVDEELLSAVLTSPDNLEALARAYNNQREPGMKLLLAMIGIFCTVGHELLKTGGNKWAWRKLGSVLRQMYHAQRSVTCTRARHLADGNVISLLEAKSVLPPVAVACISALRPGLQRVPPAWLQVGEIRGRLYWAIDELVDLLDDLRRESPSVLLIELERLVSNLDRSWITDADIYECVHIESAHISEIVDPKHGSPLCALPGVLELARFRVAAWGGWDEEPSEPMTPTRASRSSNGCEPAQTSIQSATGFLLENELTNYCEAVHSMTFPRVRGGAIVMETHATLLFQRTVILDALLDAVQFTDVPERIVANHAMTILKSKHRGVLGGWSYIPEVPELPPDADDLGAVLSDLSRCGGPFLAQTCDDAILLALAGVERDGSFPTWILDVNGQSSADEDCRAYLWIGGRGTHPEVVANMLCGLHVYDALRFADYLHGARGYFEATQGSDGFWRSRWYAGPFYGTYRVIDFLTRVDPSHNSVGQARQALVAEQRLDGGWGEKASDPLSTSFAVLSLTGNNDLPVRLALDAAVRYLLGVQAEDGGWASCAWIAFQTGVGLESYGSRCITAAYCLKAIAATRRTNAEGNGVGHSARVTTPGR